MKYYGVSEQLAEGPPVIYNGALKHTSSWANTYLDRDHHAAKAGPPDNDHDAAEPVGTGIFFPTHERILKRWQWMD